MLLSIITARGGSKSIPLKNLFPVNNKPLIEYPISASLTSNSVSETWVDTDSIEIEKVSKNLGAKVSHRPKLLAGDDVNHGDCIKNAYIRICEKLNCQFKYVLVLLGNTVMIDNSLIDQAYNKLLNNQKASGLLTAWKAGDDHPLRAMYLGENGFLDASEAKCSTNRQSYKDVYFYDQGIWMFKSENLFQKEPIGPGPWWWMGETCIMLERPWITGRDVNGMFDIKFHEFWVKSNVDMF